MNKQYPTNKEVYRIGDKVLNALRLPDEEVERIAAEPYLFDPVRAAMESAQPRVETRHSLSGWPIFRNLCWQNALAGLGVFVVFAGGAIGIAQYTAQHYLSSDVAFEIQAPLDIPQLAPALDPSDAQDEVQHSEYVRQNDHKKTRALKVRSVKREVRPETEEFGEFQALTFAYDPDADENGQIVRVELPRASLLAMGIDMQVENESVKIKAELLIGEDGIAKAVRLVN